MRKRKAVPARLLVCVDNAGYGVSLEKRKIYIALPDPVVAQHGQVRVIDESGEDYLYPKSCFLPISLPQSVRKAVVAVA